MWPCLFARVVVLVRSVSARSNLRVLVLSRMVCCVAAVVVPITHLGERCHDFTFKQSTGGEQLLTVVFKVSLAGGAVLVECQSPLQVVNNCSIPFSVLLAHEGGRLAHVGWTEPRGGRVSVVPQGESTDLRIALTSPDTLEKWRLSTPILVSSNVESQQTIRILTTGRNKTTTTAVFQTSVATRGRASTLEVSPAFVVENCLPFDAAFGLYRRGDDIGAVVTVEAASGTDAHLFEIDPSASADGGRDLFLLIRSLTAAYGSGSVLLEPGREAPPHDLRLRHNTGFFPPGVDPAGLTVKIVYTAKHKVEVFVDFWLCNVSGVSLRVEYGKEKASGLWLEPESTDTGAVCGLDVQHGAVRLGMEGSGSIGKFLPRFTRVNRGTGCML